MKNLKFIFLIALLFACSPSKKEVPEKSIENQLVVESGNEYTEYYEGKKQVKMHGYFNDKKERDGKWEYFSAQGVKLSLTFYENGKKNGFSVVFYPNGAQRYVGEYQNDQKIGEWKYYDQNGKLVQSKTF